jgi:hypothetical protein
MSFSRYECHPDVILDTKVRIREARQHKFDAVTSENFDDANRVEDGVAGHQAG